MSIDNSCGLMVGMPYHLVVTEENSELIENMIYNGDLNIGSIYYDSPKEENIVGFTIDSADTYKQLIIESVLVKYKEYNRKFYDIFDQFGNVYMTLNIT